MRRILHPLDVGALLVSILVLILLLCAIMTSSRAQQEPPAPQYCSKCACKGEKESKRCIQPFCKQQYCCCPRAPGALTQPENQKGELK